MRVKKYGTIVLTEGDGIEMRDWDVDCENQAITDSHEVYCYIASAFYEELVRRLGMRTMAPDKATKPLPLPEAVKPNL